MIDLRHVVELSLGAAFDLGEELPPPDLASDLCPNSLESTLGLHCRDYWQEVNPLLARCSINNKCPVCSRLIKVNMSCHLRLVHTELVCYWR